jgi:hypothetical protein
LTRSKPARLYAKTPKGFFRSIGMEVREGADGFVPVRGWLLSAHLE